MNFLWKVFSLLIVLFTAYLLAIFFAPDWADAVGKDIGILSFNRWIRELKGGADVVSENMLQLKGAGETLSGARGVVDKTKELFEKTQAWFEATRQTIVTKVDQVNKVADSIEKAKDSVTELQKNINDLTSFSGTTTGSGN